MLWLWLACAGPDGAPDPIAVMRTRPLAYTRHARCRMSCRAIDEAEVAQVLRDGVLEPDRTRLDGECPSHALRGRTADGQEARVVFAACPDETRVVTVIDLGADPACDCDGP